MDENAGESVDVMTKRIQGLLSLPRMQGHNTTNPIVNELQKKDGLAVPLPLLEVHLNLRDLDENDVRELFETVQGMTDNFDFSCAEMPVEEEEIQPEQEILEPKDEVWARRYWIQPMFEDEDYPTKEK